ncbi:MAG: hypothetical protein ATN35_01885 [Epulopiscium sp. Nele67-Bin004]|nr:MAG: hypothetical protein ATN35_01885 [Epulopiscium sp. Nele67-Bin004]
MIRVEESDMVFEFPEEQIFLIEHSKLHKSVGKGIKTVEFILHRRQDTLEFVEAKSSSPRPTSDNNIRFNEFIDEISDKFIRSFNVYYSAILQRHNTDEINEAFYKIDNSQVKYNFILIINGHKKEWLLAIEEAIQKKINYHTKIWKSNVLIMNHETAIQKKLIKSHQ